MKKMISRKKAGVAGSNPVQRLNKIRTENSALDLECGAPRDS